MIVRRRVFTTIIIAALTALALIGAVVVPSVLAINDTKTKIASQQANIDQQVAMFRYVRQSMANFADTKSRLAMLSEVALHEGKELDFITSLEGIAQIAGVTQTISLLTANQHELSPWEKMFPVRLTVSGTYPAVREYLRDLERLPYNVSLNGVDLTVPSQNYANNPSGLVEAQINGTVYWIGADAPDFTGTVAPPAAPPAADPSSPQN